MSRNLMTINYKKCGVMELHGNKYQEEKTVPNFGSFPTVQTYKYLGMEIN